MRVAIRGLGVASAGAVLTALYLVVVVPRLLDPDNLAAPLLFVGLPLFFIHALLLATLCGSFVCASRALYTERSSPYDRWLYRFRDQSSCHGSFGLLVHLSPCSWPLRHCNTHHLTTR
jgi:hypothetical protein